MSATLREARRVLDEARGPRRWWSLARRSREGQVDIPLVFHVQRDKGEAYLARFAPEVYREPQNARLDLMNQERVADIPGAELDPTATLDGLEDAGFHGSEVVPVATKPIRAPFTVADIANIDVSKVLADVNNTDQRLTIAYASSFETPLRLLEVDDDELRFDVPVPHSDGGPGYLLKILDLQKKGTGTTLVAHSPDGSLGFWEWDSQGGFRGLNLRSTSGASLNASGLNDLDVLVMRRPDGRRVIEYRTGAYWNFLGSVELPHEVCAKDCQLGVTRRGNGRRD